MKHLLVILMLLCAATVSAQDVIVKKDGSTVVCRVVELTSTEIVYKKWSDLNGSNYVMSRADASSISYESGKKVDLSNLNNQYSPGNQSNGEANVNDNALLRIDDAINNGYHVKKAKRLKLIGWIGGATLVVGGLATLILANNHSNYWEDSEESNAKVIGGCLAGAGVVWTTGFLIASHHYRKQAQQLDFSAVYQYNIYLGSGKVLTTGIDLIRDKASHRNTMGLSLHYNL